MPFSIHDQAEAIWNQSACIASQVCSCERALSTRPTSRKYGCRAVLSSKKIPPPCVRCYLCIFSVSNTDQAHVMLVYGSPLQLSYQGPNPWSLSDRWKTKLLCNNWMTLSWLSCCFYTAWRFGDCNAAAALKSTIAAPTPTSSTLRCSRFPGNLGHGKNLSCVM